MTGWGPDLMLRALEQVGVSLRPGVVVFVLYTHGFRRVHPNYAGMGFAVPRLALRNGYLVTIPYPAPRFWQRLRLYQAARPAVWNVSDAEWALNQDILDRFRALSGQRALSPSSSSCPAAATCRMIRRDARGSGSTPSVTRSRSPTLRRHCTASPESASSSAATPTILPTATASWRRPFAACSPTRSPRGARGLGGGGGAPLPNLPRKQLSRAKPTLEAEHHLVGGRLEVLGISPNRVLIWNDLSSVS